MEDEVQLQSLAKRLINIYNACKWSKTKLHLRRKKRSSRKNIERTQFNEIFDDGTTQIEDIFQNQIVVNRCKGKTNRNHQTKEDKVVREVFSSQSEIPSGTSNQWVWQYYPTKQSSSPKKYGDNQIVNICKCKACVCTKKATNNKGVDDSKELKKQNSKIITCVTTENSQDTSASTTIGKDCCCSTDLPKSIIKKPQTIECECPSPPLVPKERFSTSYPPTNSTRTVTCQCPNPCCPRRSPPSSHSDFRRSKSPELINNCCQCSSSTRPKCKCCPPSPSPVNSCECCSATHEDQCQCQCSPLFSPKQESSPLSPPNSGSPSPVNRCCQCAPSVPPSSEVSPITPSYNRQNNLPFTSASCCCRCPHSSTGTIKDSDKAASTYRYYAEDVPRIEDSSYCCCQSEQTNSKATIICTDKIIIPTLFCNDGQPIAAGSLSITISEEVGNEVANEMMSEIQYEDKKNNQPNTHIVLQNAGSSHRPIPAATPLQQPCPQCPANCRCQPNIVPATQSPRYLIQQPNFCQKNASYPPLTYPRLGSDQMPKGDGDYNLLGVNDDTKAEIKATLDRMDRALIEEAEAHCRKLRGIVELLGRQAGEIKELKILVAGVVDKGNTPTSEKIEKKIRKKNKKKDKKQKERLEKENRERQKKKSEHSLHERVSSNACCKCGKRKKKKKELG
ncbi:hypothetical protein HHI36_008709 [Cryptolaemus montrouzieri]|uniref:Uncharacterized protein n=1 Tax=Cryptolaemus montrouzieri TaxID=559131 RepID=A0ABD2MTC0_9CUCU